ncbi:MAG: RNA polymerase factor sigma-54 [Butyricicoccus sp.]|nr:RNA polymerase factor sigma-54 [Butyricicoccus sp.]
MRLELSQKQNLSQSLQTSMRLLQLNNLQLRDYLGELMLSNPVVDLELPDIDYRPGPFDRGRVSSHTVYEEEDFSKEQLMADKEVEISALRDLFLQAAAFDLPPQENRILEYLIHSLDEKGFLSESAQTTAQVLGAEHTAVEKCIGLLQSMDPAGVGASDLKDCLRLQLLRRKHPDEVAIAIVNDHLDLMARQQYAAIAKQLNTTKTKVMSACEHIRTLNPKPLNGLGGEVQTMFILPDFYVLEDDGHLRCVMNDYYLPRITIDPTYREILRSKTLNEADSNFIRQNYKQADEIAQFLVYRKSTLQRVVEYILEAQESFFLLGPGNRAPMNNREIAEALELHESTISRAVNDKHFECKWGVFPLKSLFVHGVTSDYEENASVDHLQQRLRELIAAEPAGSAFSDQRLADLLCAEGYDVARRTIAKYRTELGIPSSSQRSAKSRK